MTNPILRKVKTLLIEKEASLVSEFVNGAKAGMNNIKAIPFHNKLGLSMGATSVGLGIASYKNKTQDMAVNKKKQDLEEKSLDALNRIHAALKKKE